MNSQTTFFSPSLFKHDLNRNKGLIILFGILLFLAGPLILLFAFSVNNSIAGEIVLIDLSEDMYNEIKYIAQILFSLFSMAAGMLVACIVCHRYCTQQSAFFYSGLPIKRCASFITDTLCGILVYAVCFAANCIFAAVILAVNSSSPFFLAFKMILDIFAEGMAYYFIVYSIFILSGQFCANLFSQVVFGTTLSFYLPVLSIIIVETIGVFNATFSADFYLKYVAGLSPITSFFKDVFNESVHHENLIFWLILSLVALILSCIMFVKRKSETAGESLTNIWSRYLIRAMYILPASLGGAIIFYSIGDHMIIWTLIGFAIGAVLAHMAINATVFKNVAKLFYGMISFAMICAVGLVILFGAKADIFGISKLPEKEKVNKITISGIGFGDDFTSTSPDIIQNVYELAEYAQKHDYRYFDDDLDPHSDSYYIDVALYTAGIPKANEYYFFDDNGEAEKIINKIKDNDEFAEFEFERNYGYMFSFNKPTTTVSVETVSSGTVKKIETDKIFEALRKDLWKASDSEYKDNGLADIRFDSPTPVSSNLYSTEYSFTINSSMVNTLEYLNSVGYHFDTEYISKHTDTIRVLYDYEITYELQNCKEFEDIPKKVYENCTEASYSGGYAEIMFFLDDGSMYTFRTYNATELKELFESSFTKIGESNPDYSYEYAVEDIPC